MNESDLIEKLKQLRPEIKPGKDLWAGIEKQIVKPRRRFPNWMLAAAGMFMTACGVLLWQSYMTVAKLGPDDVRLWAQQWQSEQLQYASEVRQLTAEISNLEQRQQLMLGGDYEKGLKGVVAAERSITKAIIAQPGDEFLTRKLTDLQAIHLGLLRQLIKRSMSNA